MQLLDHLRKTEEPVVAFANRIGENFTTIRKIVYQQRQPSLTLAVKIERATDGNVTPADMLVSGPPRAKAARKPTRKSQAVTQ